MSAADSKLEMGSEEGNKVCTLLKNEDLPVEKLPIN